MRTASFCRCLAWAGLEGASLAGTAKASVCTTVCAPALQIRGSKFVKFQECKIQESPDEASWQLGS